MSENSWKNSSIIKPSLDVVRLESKVRVMMPDPVLNKIKYLCKNIPREEWSGILFYSVRGSVRKPDDMEIVLEDILPMDKGTAGATEFDIDERYTEYLMEDQSRMEWKMGLIHSHNTMPVFFSNVDMSELNDNAPAHNFYLSLIVNNFMDFMAKVAFVGTMEKEVKELSYRALDEDGKPYTVETRNFTVKKEKLYTYDCEVVSASESIAVDKDFMDKVTGIIEAPKKWQKAPGLYLGQPSLSKWPPMGKKVTVGKEPIKDSKPGKREPSVFSSLESEEDLFGDEDGFVAEVMSFGHSEEGSTLASVLEGHIKMGLTPRELAESVVNNYVAVYESFYEDAEGVDNFLETGEEFLEVLSEAESLYPIVGYTIMMMRRVLTRFEEYGTAI